LFGISNLIAGTGWEEEAKNPKDKGSGRSVSSRLVMEGREKMEKGEVRPLRKRSKSKKVAVKSPD